jgi:hypothetical protein
MLGLVLMSTNLPEDGYDIRTIQELLRGDLL